MFYLTLLQTLLWCLLLILQIPQKGLLTLLKYIIHPCQMLLMNLPQLDLEKFPLSIAHLGIMTISVLLKQGVDKFNVDRGKLALKSTSRLIGTICWLTEHISRKPNQICIAIFIEDRKTDPSFLFSVIDHLLHPNDKSIQVRQDVDATLWIHFHPDF